MLSKSRYYRRLHRLLRVLSSLFGSLGALSKQGEGPKGFVVDTYPVPICQNIRIKRSRILKGEVYRGYSRSKRGFFYGYKLVLITTVEGAFSEVALVPGSMHDRTALDFLPFDVSEDSLVLADKAFTDDSLEELWFQAGQVWFTLERKKDHKQRYSLFFDWMASRLRKRIETVGSQIKALWPYCLHAVTQAGFELKVLSFVLAYALIFLINQ